MPANLYITPAAAREAILASRLRRSRFLFGLLADNHARVDLRALQLERNRNAMKNAPPSKKNILTKSIASLLGPQSQNAAARAVINFQCSTEEMVLVQRIAARGLEMAQAHGVPVDPMIAAMDILATHCNGRPLHLMRLLTCDNDDFSHDFTAIGRNIDRATGRLPLWVSLRCQVTKQ